MTPGTPAPWTEWLLLGVLASLWGSSYLLIKIAVSSIPPLTLIAMRVSIAMGFLLLVMRLRRMRLPVDGDTWRRLSVQSFLNSFGSWTLLAWGQQFVGAGLAGVLNSTSPLFVFFIALVWSRSERVDAWKLAGTALGFAGVCLVVGPATLDGFGTALAGQAAILVGALMYACAALNGKSFATLPPVVTAAGTMVVATAILVPASLLIDRPWRLAPAVESLAAAVLLGLFCTGMALTLYFRLVRTLGAMGVASQSYLRAGISVLLGMTILGETVTPAVGIGLCAILAGVAIILSPRPRTA